MKRKFFPKEGSSNRSQVPTKKQKIIKKVDYYKSAPNKLSEYQKTYLLLKYIGT